MVINIQPDEGISLSFEAKVPGPVVRLGAVNMNFEYSDYFGTTPSTGYETLIYDCMMGDPTLFQRADMVEAAWTVVQPILDVWKALPQRDFPNYAAGTWGPAQADQLLQTRRPRMARSDASQERATAHRRSSSSRAACRLNRSDRKFSRVSIDPSNQAGRSTAPFCYNSVTQMDFDHLVTFFEIAKQGSFSRAGQKLYRSQPAVSAQIRQLEQEYGQKLFDRVGKSVRLTVAGETLLEYACRLLTLRNESLRAVADQASTPRGTLAVGANEATCLYVLPDIFAEYSRRFPSVQISIYRNFSHKVLEKVEDGTVDVGIVTLPVKSPSLKVHPIFRDRLMLMVSPDESSGCLQERAHCGHRRAAVDFSEDRLHAPGARQAVSPVPFAPADNHGAP